MDSMSAGLSPLPLSYHGDRNLRNFLDTVGVLDKFQA